MTRRGPDMATAPRSAVPEPITGTFAEAAVLPTGPHLSVGGRGPATPRF